MNRSRRFARGITSVKQPITTPFLKEWKLSDFTVLPFAPRTRRTFPTTPALSMIRPNALLNPLRPAPERFAILVEQYKLDAVIKLPSGVFQP